MTHCDCPSCNRPGKVRRFFNWLESCPGGFSTLVLLAFFVAGAWGVYLIFQVKGK